MKAAPHPTKQPVYSSASMHVRRQRMLEEARKIITEQGIEGFSVRELCIRAGVAQRTLYNAFHSRERLIAIAIREAYDEVVSRITYKTSPTTLAGIIDRILVVNTSNTRAKNKNYIRAVAALYFSPQAQHDIWGTLQEMAFVNLRRWLATVEAEGLFEPWVNVGELAQTMVNHEYATIHDWALDRMTNEQYLRRIVLGILQLTYSSTRDPLRSEAGEMMRQIGQTGRLPVFPAPTLRLRTTNSAAA